MADVVTSNDFVFLNSLEPAQARLIVSVAASELPTYVEVPKPKHRCRAAVVGLEYDRCACGAVRLHSRNYWMGRNTR
jgi:hypothetical protein